MIRMFVLLVLLAPFSMAQVEVSTSIRYMSVGTDQLAGELTMQLRDDVFSDARPWNPVYVRLALEDEVTLSETRATGWGDEIYLPIRVTGVGATISAPALTLSILRWKEGESSIWLRVSVPTSTWVTVDGAHQAPSDEYPVQIAIGQTVSAYNQLLDDDFENGTANLPSAYAHFEPTGTEIRVDLTEDALSPQPLVEFSGYSASMGFLSNVGWPVPESHIRAGSDSGVFFTGDVYIGAVSPR